MSLFRKSRGLTQRALADLAGTSQQQVQRIEAGIQGVRLELATRIANALGSQLGDVFPFMENGRRVKGLAASRYALKREQLVEAGIDPDPAVWTVKLFAHDGRVFLYQVPSDEKARLERMVSDGDGRFVIFTSDTHRVALNLRKFAATQFLFDFDLVDSTNESPEKLELSLHLIASKEPVAFDVEPDQKSQEEADDDSSSQLQNLFFYLEMGQEEDEVISFDDVDGESVYVRTTEVLAIEVPLVCVEPALQNAEFEGYLEDEMATKASSDPEKVAR
jgi:transcriptional regulator with XRE-family HTH domain